MTAPATSFALPDVSVFVFDAGNGLHLERKFGCRMTWPGLAGALIVANFGTS